MTTVFIGENSIKTMRAQSVEPLPLELYTSPLRYPGGKSKVVRELAGHVRPGRRYLVEACAGGASLSLAMLKNGMLDSVWLNDKDPHVYAFWQIATSEYGQKLIERVKANPKPTHNDFLDAKLVLLDGPIQKTWTNKLERAWAYLLVNRLAFGGNINAGPIGGYDGEMETLLSRWDADQIVEKLQFIYEHRHKFIVTKYDVLDVIKHLPKREADTITVYFDPPKLSDDSPYMATMTVEDHKALIDEISLYQGKLDFMVTVGNDKVGKLWENLFEQGEEEDS